MIMCGSHLGTAFVPSYYAFFIMRFFGGFGNVGYWNSAMILGSLIYECTELKIQILLFLKATCFL
jgi:hypothetical protein